MPETKIYIFWDWYDCAAVIVPAKSKEEAILTIKQDHGDDFKEMPDLPEPDVYSLDGGAIYFSTWE